ncbi:Pyruvate/2-oxoglutarate dehydrogenase complex, dihydrolipoamide acyltransferase (E2) component, and related enzymes [plant metagenome]|uniref:Pyruvate/2-oxoglutarate dehydrogenase complex, dihydrolipoamide acyltransferase (E2) component, and related enzymes n=1 Tax=plant metagenome TaxID=1297885 RepID=A0A484VFZ9_9ZZZZ
MFNVLQDHGMVLPAADGKAIWRATISSDSGWSHSFTLLRLAPALIWESDERPTSFTGTVLIGTTSSGKEADAPSLLSAAGAEAPPGEEGGITTSVSPSLPQAMPDIMEEMLAIVSLSGSASAGRDSEQVPDEVPALSPEPPVSAMTVASPLSSASASAVAPPSSTVQPSGEHFMAWLKQGITSRRLIINDSKALIHTVSDTTYLVSPGLFQRYAREYPQVEGWASQDKLQGWQWVQKRFERLGRHRKQPGGLNIWTCEVHGPRKSRQLHGYLLVEPSDLFTECPPNNTYLKVMDK